VKHAEYRKESVMAARLFRTVLVFLFGVTLLFPVRTAWATAPPLNDDFDSATIISSLPFTDTLDTSGATSAPDDPTSCGNNASVWYAFTPTQNEVVRTTTSASGYLAFLSVYTGTRGALTAIACGFTAPLVFSAQAGTTYFLMVSACCGTGGGGGGNLVLSASVVPPPSNDDFANAGRITTLPFSDTADTTAATLEPGEPAPTCGGDQLAGSVWYVFTPAVSEEVSATDQFGNSLVAAYTGTSVANLSMLGCRAFGTPLTLQVSAGTTYYFQTGGLFGQRGLLTFDLVVTPPPSAGFFFSPPDPSIFDDVQFFDSSFDPVQIGIQSEAWDFGDGTTATGTPCCAITHRYAADADYMARLTVTTFDGRTASTSQTVHVKTHDVAITKLTVPQAAKAGQTRALTVGISDFRYPETVQVQLLKSGTGSSGFQVVGTLTQSVSVLPGNRTTPFDFTYTFTGDDAVAGKVSFEAVATIVNARDAQPADNTALALPTTVTG
jgi:hypothetical protein